MMLGRLPSQRPVVGIDIGKRRHAAAGVTADGRDFQKPIAFFNHRADLDRLEQTLLVPLQAEGPVLVAIEATGHYWMCPYFELTKRGYECIVLNPIETRSKQRRRIRKNKTDKIDAKGIARFVREGKFSRSRIPDPETFELRLLARHRWRLSEIVRQFQLAGSSFIELLFPEYEAVFSDPWMPTSRALIRGIGVEPANVLQRAREVRPLVRRASRGRISDAKVDLLLSNARDTLGLQRAESVLSRLIRTSLQLIEATEKEIAAIDRTLASRAEALHSPLESLGLRPHLIATIHAECDPITDFRNSRQFVAYVGLDPSNRESGDPHPGGGRPGRISKRGPRRLRHAFYLAAMGLYRHKRVLRDAYERARRNGHHHTSALVVVANLLARIVFRMLTEKRPFDPEGPPAAPPS